MSHGYNTLHIVPYCFPPLCMVSYRCISLQTSHDRANRADAQSMARIFISAGDRAWIRTPADTRDAGPDGQRPPAPQRCV